MRTTTYVLGSIVVFIAMIAVPLYGMAALSEVTGGHVEWVIYTRVVLALLPVQILTGGWFGCILDFFYKQANRERQVSR
ncbi:MAG TPA: hypothetical protein VIF43_01255 [Patescibacteria group bacterium]|jgi:hypothetical protein